jgi:ankyrin repeat protein
LRSSPTDQLVAAILDGDVQGVRAVVRSKGEDLNSAFWKELARSVLPLHRAVSGLHFHGSERLLVATIEALTQLGADVNATDQAGNTVLHKAIQVCTSKSVGNVVVSLIARGANAGAKNRNGDSPLHLECDRCVFIFTLLFLRL